MNTVMQSALFNAHISVNVFHAGCKACADDLAFDYTLWGVDRFEQMTVCRTDAYV